MVNHDSLLQALSRAMGKRGTIPGGNNSDWEAYIQESFNYSWRYFKWDWTLRYVTVNLATDPYLPADFDLGGYREAIGDETGSIAEVTLIDYARQPSGLRSFAIQYDSVANRYQVLTKSGLPTIDFVYQVAPPSLDSKDTNGAYVSYPFPSSTTIGIGASIYAKNGENPNRADVSQEWDMFHAELDRHVGRADKNVPRSTNLNLQDFYGTYTGDVRG